MYSPLALSTTLLTAVFQEWLGVGCLLELDSTCCSTASRKAYLEVVQCGGFWLGSATNQVIKARSMKWFIERKVKVKKAWMSESGGIDLGMATAFLHVSAATLETIWITGFTDAVLLAGILDSLRFSAPRLSVLGVDRCDAAGSTALGALLSSAAHTLRRLKLTNCTVSDTFSVSRLPHMESLQLYCCNVEAATWCQLISSCPNLRIFSCTNLQGRGDCLDALAAHCPLLQVLHYGDGDSDVASLVRVLQACPDIEVVEMSAETRLRNSSATGSHVAAVTLHCKKLKALRFSAGASSGITDASVMMVASRLDEMRHLWWDGFLTDQPMVACSEHCRNLVTLELHARHSDVSQDALVTFVSQLHSVVEIRMQEFELSDPVLEAIAVHCPRLQVLNLYGCQGYTVNGIAALARGCPALKKVYVRQDEQLLTPMARLLWQIIRPGLEFPPRNDLTSVWRNVFDISRDELVVW